MRGLAKRVSTAQPTMGPDTVLIVHLKKTHAEMVDERRQALARACYHVIMGNVRKIESRKMPKAGR